MLTGKAKEDFHKYISYRFGEDENDLRLRYEIYIQALILEWLDSVKINIHTDITSEYYIGKVYVTSLNHPDFIGKYYHNVDRKHVIKQLIEKANEIYNNPN